MTPTLISFSSPLLLPPTLILITIVLFILIYFPILVKNTIHNHTNFLFNELSNDIDIFVNKESILTSLKQSIPNYNLSNISQKTTIQTQIYKKLFYIFIISTSITFFISNKSSYNLSAINNIIFISLFISLTLYLFSHFIIEQTIFTDPNVIRLSILQIANDKFKNQSIDIKDILQDFLPSEIKDITSKIEDLKNKIPDIITIPKNIIVPPTPQNLIIPPTEPIQTPLPRIPKNIFF